jgi:glycosyltransferase involved in cell wall biosynthesis
VSGSPRLSVVIPTLARPRLLAAAVESVLRQTRPVDQIVIVDDVSPSGPDSAVVDRPDAPPVIEILRTNGFGGAAAARNLGLEHATGTHVLFLDDDDLVHPRFCETALAAFAERPQADVVTFRYECFFEPQSLGDALPVALLFDYRTLAEHPLERIGAGNPAPADLLEARPVSAFLRYLIPVHASLARRDAIGDTRFPETLRQGEDTHFWISLAAAGRRFVARPEVYAYVRRHPGNTTRSRDRYALEIQSCYEALLAGGILRARDDAFLAHLKLLWFRVATRRRDWGSHLGAVASAPDLLFREIAFWAANLRSRRHLLRYFFGP